MGKCILFAAMGVFILSLNLAWAQKSTMSPRQASPVFPSGSQLVSASGFSTVSLLRATPSTIPFTANDPGYEIVGGTVATVVWNITQGKFGQTWALWVGASSSSFQGCATVPESAVSVKCTSASVEGGGQASAGCNVHSFTTLPDTLPGLQVASGNEGNSSMHTYNVVLTYRFQDSWRYIANTCPLNLTYTVNAQ
jgi:hypothetical protein